MATLIVLIVVWGVARLIGFAGVEAGDTWAASARIGLAAMFAMAGVTHFTKMRHDFVKMVPPVFAEPMAMVYFTGVCEILGAAGILIPGTRQIAGICLAILLVAMFPANMQATRKSIRLRGKLPTPLPFRAAMQIFYIAVTLWSTQAGR